MADSAMPWVKLWNDFLDDPKMGRLARSTRLTYIELILIAGECDANGNLTNGEIPMTVDDITWRLRVDKESFIADLKALMKAGVIQLLGGTYLVVNFEKRQGRSQTEKRAMWRERQTRYREKQTKQDIPAALEVTNALVTRDTPVTNASSIEKRREEERRGEERSGAFAPPHHDDGEIPESFRKGGERNPEISGAVAPDTPDSNCKQVLSDDSNGKQPITNVPEESRNRESRIEESRGPALQAPPPSQIPQNGVHESEQEPAHKPRDLLFDAVAEVTASNPTLLGSRIAKLANELRKLNATPEQVHQVARWYAVNDWRGKKGEKLTFEILKEVWELGVRNTRLTPAIAGGKNVRRPQAPDSTEEQREAARAEARKRIAERAARKAAMESHESTTEIN